jgi:hypothetical protein
MTNGMDRRELLKRAAVVTAFGCVTRSTWAFAAWPPGLTTDVIAVLEQITHAIIPTDETAGAAEAAVVDRLIRALDETPSLRQLYTTGAAEVDGASRCRFGRGFVTLTPGEQQAVLEAVQTTEFFQVLREQTITAFYQSRVGEQSVGFPGPGQPHGYATFTEAPSRGHRPADPSPADRS